MQGSADGKRVAIAGFEFSRYFRFCAGQLMDAAIAAWRGFNCSRRSIPRHARIGGRRCTNVFVAVGRRRLASLTCLNIFAVQTCSRGRDDQMTMCVTLSANLDGCVGAGVLLHPLMIVLAGQTTLFFRCFLSR